MRPILSMFCRPRIRRSILRSELERQIGVLEGKKWNAAQIDLLPESFQRDIPEGGVSVEVYLLEWNDDQQVAHIAVSIDDGSFILQKYPICDDFLVHVEKISPMT